MSICLKRSKPSYLLSGAIGAVLVFLGVLFCNSLPFGLACAAVFWACNLITIQVDNPYLAALFTLGIAGASAVVNWLLVQLNLNIISYLYCIGITGKTTYVLSTLCYFVLIAVVYTLTLNMKASVFTSFVITMVLSTIDYFVIQFRGNEIAPSDLFAARTALNVAANYNFTITSAMAHSWMLALLWNFLVIRCVKLPKPSKKIISRAASLILTIACVVFIASKPQYIVYNQWQFWGSARNGFLLNFVYQFQTLEKPEEYKTFDFSAAEEDYAQSEVPEKKPNVLVIMNEVFTDFRCFNGSLNTNIPVTPYFDSLTENTIRGYAIASIFGGGTSNSEYEFLTGNTLGFLPPGANGYQQYVKENSYTLNTYFRSLGYHTVAMHPHYGNGWTRSTVWPWMKFDEIYFRDGVSFSEENHIRNWISDMEMYDKVLKAFENKPDDKPLFLFGVTVQNHGDYENIFYQNSVSLEGYSTEYPRAEQYLSLLNESDQALEYLFTKLEEMDEDVIVLFYGDHQPKIETEFYEELNGGDLDDITSQQKNRIVPFVVWANYDIPEATVELTSLNYLSNYLLEAADFPLPPYNQFLKEAEATIPALNALGYYSSSANAFLTYEEAEGTEKEMLTKYQILQYNSLKGGKNRSSVFFP